MVVCDYHISRWVCWWQENPLPFTQPRHPGCPRASFLYRPPRPNLSCGSALISPYCVGCGESAVPLAAALASGGESRVRRLHLLTFFPPVVSGLKRGCASRAPPLITLCCGLCDGKVVWFGARHSLAGWNKDEAAAISGRLKETGAMYGAASTKPQRRDES